MEKINIEMQELMELVKTEPSLEIARKELESARGKREYNQKLDEFFYRLFTQWKPFRFYAGEPYYFIRTEGRFRKAEMRDVKEYLILVQRNFDLQMSKSKCYDIANMLTYMPELKIKAAFNSNSNFINCKNCVIEIMPDYKIQIHKKTMELAEKLCFNYMIDANYIATEQTPYNTYGKTLALNKICETSFVYNDLTNDKISAQFHNMQTKYYECYEDYFCGPDNEDYENSSYDSDCDSYDDEEIPFWYESINAWEVRRLQLLEIIGYCCSDFPQIKKAFFFIGQPHSGKSMLLKFMVKLLGEDALKEKLVTAVPLHGLENKQRLADACLAKLNVNGELRSKPLENIENFKLLLGGDMIWVEKKDTEAFAATTKVRLMFAGNTLPVMHDLDPTSAFHARVHLVYFSKSIPHDEQDEYLFDKLWKERDAIFSEAIRALANLSKRKFRFTSLPEDAAYLKSYESEKNSFIKFWNEKIYKTNKGEITSQKLHEYYRNFTRENMLEELPWRDCQTILRGFGYYPSKVHINGEKTSLQGYKGIDFDESARCRERANAFREEAERNMNERDNNTGWYDRNEEGSYIAKREAKMYQDCKNEEMCD